MGYHPRIETPDMGSFTTTRSRNSELWFVNNRPLEEVILGNAAKCVERYSVKLYALAIEGDHSHTTSLFPESNRSSFMRDLNSFTARAVNRLVAQYPGGRFWGRRYSAEILPGDEDIEDRFFYTVLQPVNDGLVEKISDYPGYNCFHDAVWGIERKYKLVRWGDYNKARKRNPKAAIKDYTEIFTLKYDRLPGYEHLSQREYALLMEKKLEERRVAVVNKRREKGQGFAGREALLRVRPGAKPQHTKTSDINSHRPRVLSVCPLRWKAANDFYYSVYAQYKDASRRYRAGELNVKFPPGTYMPPAVTRAIPPPG